MHYVTIPGIDGSDHEHWQSIWEAEWGQRASRISVLSWSLPELDDWCDAIDRAVLQVGSPGAVLVAHSLGCLAAARWTARRPTRGGRRVPGGATRSRRRIVPGRGGHVRGCG